MIPQRDKIGKPKISESTQSSMSSMVDSVSPKNVSAKDQVKPVAPLQPKPIPESNKTKVGNVDTGFYTTVASSSMPRIRNNDGAATIVAKQFSFINRVEEKRKIQRKMDLNFSRENEDEEKKLHENILKSLEVSDDKVGSDKFKIIKPKQNKTSKIAPSGGKKFSTKIKAAAMLGGAAAVGVGAASFMSDKTPSSPKESDTASRQPPSSIQSPSYPYPPQQQSQVKEEPTKTPEEIKKTIKQKISGRESGSDPAAVYNTMNRGVYGAVKGKKEGQAEGNTYVVKSGNLDVGGKKYKKDLTEMTLGEVVKLAQSRSATFNRGGAGAAAGKYQFMPITIHDRGLKVFGKEWEKEKFSEENQEKMMDSLLENSADKLKKAGVPVTDANIYLVHFTGNADLASKLSKSKDDALMSSIISKSESLANPNVAKMTVGAYKEDLKAKTGFDFKEIDLNAKPTASQQTPNPSATRVRDTGTVTSEYGMRNGSQHEGIDIAAPQGTPVNATFEGKVTSAGMTSGGYGNLIEIDHGNGTVTRYGHLASIDVKVGDSVKAGQKIGGVGSTGRSSGNHLHYEIRRNGKAVDPRQNVLSQINPVGTTSLTETDPKTGDRISDASSQNNDLTGSGASQTVAMIDSTNTVINSRNNQQQSVSMGSVKDLPLFLTPIHSPIRIA
jgi:murein DD-endopeptidase MepM/ murein hydrolase activator NlpD